MKIILNDHAGTTTFRQALGELVEGAHTLSVAVSYYLVSGIGYTFSHKKGSHKLFVLTNAGQIGFDPVP
jgi:hypothetical protein